MAPNAEEADTWVKTIRAITDAVQHNKFAKKTTTQTGRRNKLPTPAWKKKFWDEKEIGLGAISEPTTEKKHVKKKLSAGATDGLFKAALGKPKLMKKLLTLYDNDVKILKLLIKVLLTKEVEQTHSSISEEPGTSETKKTKKELSLLNQTPTVFEISPTSSFGESKGTIQNFKVQSVKFPKNKHRRVTSNWADTARGGQKRRAVPILSRSNSGMLHVNAKALKKKPKNLLERKSRLCDLFRKPVDKFWYYQDGSKKSVEAPQFEFVLKTPAVLNIFKEYLSVLYQDGGLLFVCDVDELEKGVDPDGNSLNQSDLMKKADRIFNKYVSSRAEIPLTSDEGIRKRIRSNISKDPTNAFAELKNEIVSDVKEQYAEFSKSNFYKKISTSVGPILEHKLALLFEEEKIKDDTTVWKVGTKISLWRSAQKVDVFKDAMCDRSFRGELTKQENDIIFRWLKTPGNKSTFLMFKGLESEQMNVRSLACRAIWLVLRAREGYNKAKQSYLSKTFIDFFTAARKHSATPISQVMENHSILQAMLFNPCTNFANDFGPEKAMLQPTANVYNAALWPAIFVNLNNTNLYPRVRCLQDTYFHLVKKNNASSTLLKIRNWHTWLLPLALDTSSQALSTGDTIKKLHQYITGMVSSMLWDLVKNESFDVFVKQIRNIVASTIALCADNSFQFTIGILSAMVSRFHNTSKKWHSLEEKDHKKRILCFHHLSRLSLAMALNISSNRWAVRDTLKTNRCLPKETNEKHHKVKEVKYGEVDNEQQSLDKPRPSVTGRTSVSRSRDKRVSIYTQYDIGDDIATDQEIIYLLRVLQHSKEQAMRNGGESSTKKVGLISSINLNQYYVSQHSMANLTMAEREKALLRLENQRFDLTSEVVIDILGKRKQDFKESLSKFRDSKHICANEIFKTAIELTPYNLAWKESLHEYLDLLHKIQNLLIEIRHQNEDHEKNGMVPFTHEIKKLRLKLQDSLTFVNDSVGFLDLMHNRLWALLESKQVEELVHEFAYVSDPAKRKKVFKGWEKEKKRNDAKKDKKIEKKLKLQQERLARTFMIVLVGPGQSGKSTVFKQLTILHGRGFDDNVKRKFRKQIYSNIVGALKNILSHLKAIEMKTDETLGELDDQNVLMHEILHSLQTSGNVEEAKKVSDHIRAMTEIGSMDQRYRAYLLEAAADENMLNKALECKKETRALKSKIAKYNEIELPSLVDQFFQSFVLNSKNVKHVKTLSEAPYEIEKLTASLDNAVNSLWKDPAVQAVYARRARFKHNQVDDSVAYMLENIQRIFKYDENNEYLPSQEDILHCRQRTLGIIEGEFEVKKQIFKVVDVAGQRGARKKWIPMFQQANACLFVCSLAGYNRFLLEDTEKLRIHEALDLFEDVVNQRALSRIPIILFLNKVDLFEKDLKTVSLQQAFPQYSGENDNLDQAVDFVKSRFRKKLKDRNRDLIMHTTCATDTDQVGKIFDSVIEIVVKQQLRSAGLL